jgi:hypothetical protein
MHLQVRSILLALVPLSNALWQLLVTCDDLSERMAGDC